MKKIIAILALPICLTLWHMAAQAAETHLGARRYWETQKLEAD